MQEDVLQPLLTVTEAMVTAAKLKLGTEIGHDEKLEVVWEKIALKANTIK